MVILKLLSEEVFDFSSGQITQVKAKHLKDRQVIVLEFLSNFSNNFKELEVFMMTLIVNEIRKEKKLADNRDNGVGKTTFFHVK